MLLQDIVRDMRHDTSACCRDISWSEVRFLARSEQAPKTGSNAVNFELREREV